MSNSEKRDLDPIQKQPIDKEARKITKTIKIIAGITIIAISTMLLKSSKQPIKVQTPKKPNTAKYPIQKTSIPLKGKTQSFGEENKEFFAKTKNGDMIFRWKKLKNAKKNMSEEQYKKTIKTMWKQYIKKLNNDAQGANFVANEIGSYIERVNESINSAAHPNQEETKHIIRP